MRSFVFYKEFWYYLLSTFFFITSLTSFVFIKNRTGTIVDINTQTQQKINELTVQKCTLKKRYIQTTSSQNILALSKKYITMTPAIIKKNIISMHQFNLVFEETQKG